MVVGALMTRVARIGLAGQCLYARAVKDLIKRPANARAHGENYFHVQQHSLGCATIV